MTEQAVAAGTARELKFEFKGRGGEFFRIWIVNLLLTIITLGIYGAWAKVRTNRYMLANSWVDGHNFDYHASPIRILIGRLILVLFIAAYAVATTFSPLAMGLVILLIVVAAPWLIVAGLRFNARNTSYRNVRFNFSGRYWGAFKVFYLWTLAVIATLGILMPLARRAWDYFIVNHHRFGGKPFAVKYSGGSIYWIFISSFLILLAAGAVIGVGMTMAFIAGGLQTSIAVTPLGSVLITAATIPLYLFVITYVRTRIFNLVLNHTILDGRHKLASHQSVFRVFWIFLTNVIFMVLTLGLYYPWAHIRMRRYMVSHLTLFAATNLDEFTSEAIATQGAIGEEFASYFDFDIGL